MAEGNGLVLAVCSNEVASQGMSLVNAFLEEAGLSFTAPGWSTTNVLSVQANTLYWAHFSEYHKSCVYLSGMYIEPCH